MPVGDDHDITRDGPFFEVFSVVSADLFNNAINTSFQLFDALASGVPNRVLNESSEPKSEPKPLLSPISPTVPSGTSLEDLRCQKTFIVSCIVVSTRASHMARKHTIVPLPDFFGKCVMGNVWQISEQYMEGFVSSLPWRNIDSAKILRINKSCLTVRSSVA